MQTLVHQDTHFVCGWVLSAIHVSQGIKGREGGRDKEEEKEKEKHPSAVAKMIMP